MASFAGAYAAVTGNGTPVLASISQNGDQLTLNGSATASATLIVSPGNFIAGGGASYPPQLISNGGVVATSSNNSIKFMTGPLAGQTWTKLDLPLNYVNLQGAATQVIQNGASLTFVITATGQTSNGTWISPTQVSAFGQTGTVGSGKITWSGGNVWTENLVVNGSILLAGTSTNLSGAATIAASPNLFFTNYTNLGGAATHVIQTGSSLTFVVDATGETSDGHWISPTQVAATAWGQTGTVGETGSITWSGGNVWTVKPSLLPPVTTHYTNKSGAATHLIQDGAHLTFVVDASGETSTGYWISSTQ